MGMPSSRSRRSFTLHQFDLNQNDAIDPAQDFEYLSFYQGDATYFDNTNCLQSTTGPMEFNDHKLAHSIRKSVSPGREITNYGNTIEYNDCEPPLLDELEIYPERIIQKSLAIMNPMHHLDLANSELFESADLAGPILFCLVFGSSLFVSGKKVDFGYIYGLSLISVIGMYVLITLMCNKRENWITFSGVASALGYGLLPVLALSVVGIFVTLNTSNGHIVAAASIIMSTVGTSRMLCLMTNEPQQRLLIAYPTALVYIAFMFLVMF